MINDDLNPHWPTITYHDEMSVLIVAGGGMPAEDGWIEIRVPLWQRALGWILRRPVTRMFWKGPAT